MRSLRVLVCDDEALSLRRISGLLSRIPDCEVVGALDDPTEVAASASDTCPDLLLLNVEMPEMDGFDVMDTVSRMGRSCREVPLFAFTAESSQHAPAAFDSNALDFLMKPVRLHRLEDTLGRARRILSNRAAERRLAQIDASSCQAEGVNPAGDFVWVTRRGETIRVDLDLVHHIQAEGAYVRLHWGERTFLHRASISGIGRRLERTSFMRVHRSHLVRIEEVASLRRTRSGGVDLLLRSGVRVPVGRSYAKLLRDAVFSGRPDQWDGR